MRKLLVLFFCFYSLSLSKLCGQHDPLVNNYGLNQHYFNPAYTGLNNVLQVNALTRQQWAGIEGAPTTHFLSAHTNFAGTRNGLGLTVLNDRLGINNNVEVSVSYSHQIEFGLSGLSFGLQGSFVNYNYDYTSLTLETGNDLFFSDGVEEQFSKPNFGFGLFYSAPTYYAGLSIPKVLNLSTQDLLTGGLESERFRRHYYFTAGYIFDRMPDIIIKPHFLIRIVNGVPVSYDLNGSVLLREVLWLNLLIRDFNTLGISTQIKFKNFHAGYSFELPLNSLLSESFGTHEITFGIEFAAFRNQATRNRYY
ncbi:MAG: type IX secretion system membrane protein PorP/SprF [Bacteroidota bacterium]